MRPLRESHAVGHASRRIDEDAPTLGAPAERRVLVRQTRVDAECVFDLRVQQLAAAVERRELLAQAVDGLAGRKRSGRKPPLAVAPERGQPRPAAKMLVGDRAEYGGPCALEHETQRILCKPQPGPA